MLARRDRALLGAVVALHAAASLAVLASGFDHVSDDDFARVTIAQAFAHAPRLDPSGTSWLPFPFWWTGLAMAAFGRTLAVARVASVALASIGAALPLLALRQTGVGRARALAAVAFALASPWPLWLGAATVPESFTATATAAAAIALAARPSPAFAALLAAACLSRYEAWPVAATIALFSAARARPAARRRAWLEVAGIAAAAPIAWMAWNAYAHGSPLHFFHRVSAFKRAIGEGSTSTVAALVEYPRLLATTRPEVAAAALAGLVAFARSAALRRRWSLPLSCIAAQIALLAIGNARDGAPAHHPERALLGATVLAALFAVDACVDLVKAIRVSSLRAALAAAIVTLWAWSFARVAAEPPGQSAGEDRSRQLARGRDLREAGATAIVVSPCAFEHFALLAAYGAPENARVLPRSGAPVGPGCPRVDVP